jgi:hypothetical protein
MVMLVRDAAKKAMLPPKIIDLSSFMRGKSEQPVEIKKVLEPNAYGIDVREYIQQEISD